MATQPLSRSDTSSMLVAVHAEEVEQQEALMDYATQAASQRVYLLLLGELAAGPPTTATLNLLARCFDSSARLKPKLDVVPLFSFLGWTQEKVAALSDVHRAVASDKHAEDARAVLDALSVARDRLQLPSLDVALLPFQLPPAGGVEHSPLASTQSRVIGSWQGPLQFGNVAVGGTFDRLHAGHRLLLAATALVATNGIFVGITADKLLARKRNANLLQPYEAREAAAVGYMRHVNPRVQVTAGPLSDPAVPPLCALERNFDAIVVSEETIHGAEEINAVRAGLGFHPLVVVVVGLVTSAKAVGKLSSTDLREAEAAAAQK